MEAKEAAELEKKPKMQLEEQPNDQLEEPLNEQLEEPSNEQFEAQPKQELEEPPNKKAKEQLKKKKQQNVQPVAEKQLGQKQGKRGQALKSTPAAFLGNKKNQTLQKPPIRTVVRVIEAQPPRPTAQSVPIFKQFNAGINAIPEQREILRVMKLCSFENCYKPTVVNPNWNDNYCSQACMDMHLHNLFLHFLQANGVMLER